MDELSTVDESDVDSALMSICESHDSFLSTCESIGSLFRKRKIEKTKSRKANSPSNKAAWALDTDSPYVIDFVGRLLHKQTLEYDQNKKGRDVEKKVFVLLLNMNAKQFEFVEAPLSSRKLVVRRIIELASKTAEEPLLRVQRYNGLFRPVMGIKMANELRTGPNGCDIRNGEIVVALPEDHSMYECNIVGRRIIMMPEVMDIFYETAPLHVFERRFSLEPVQESTPSGTGTENVETDSKDTGYDGAEECDLHDNEDVEQGITLQDKDADNTVAEAAVLEEMVQDGIFLEVFPLPRRMSNVAKDKELKKTRLLTVEVDTAESSQIVSGVPEEFPAHISAMDVDEFMMNLGKVSEDEECQDTADATSVMSFSQCTCGEGSHLGLDPDDARRMKEFNDVFHRQGNLEPDAVNHCECIECLPNYAHIIIVTWSNSINIDYLPWIVFNVLEYIVFMYLGF